MDKIHIRGGIPLHGKIQVSGAKNAALPLMTACLLTNQPLILSNLPHLADIITMANLLIQHGVELKLDGSGMATPNNGRVICLHAAHIHNRMAPYDIVRKMRASILVLGPLLARFGEARVSLPGGCAIGTRPVDLHLNALEHMGAMITLEGGYILAKVKGRLKGAEIAFDKVSVGATENILMAATLADGVTILKNAACEPEVMDLAYCLNRMGAKIEGIGTTTLTITGVAELKGTQHKVIADRIEAGTYAIAAAMTGGEIEICGLETDIISSLLEKMTLAGIKITLTPNGILVSSNGFIQPVDITTQPYPGFPTDMQAQFMALMSVANGASVISETIFENRFMHVPELNRMGANITISGHTAMVRGVPQLTGAEVMATDLRASVSLVLAGLIAKGETTLNRVYHIDRGYENVEEKLRICGAEIRRIKRT